jgi:type I restriction enzyme S subunit
MSTKSRNTSNARHSRESGNPQPWGQGVNVAEVTLSDPLVFQTLNGLWKGKKGPLTRAIVVRNTNFTADGILDLRDVAELDVEAKQLAARTLELGDIIVERSGGGPKQAVGRVCYFDTAGDLPYSFSNFTSVIRVMDQRRLLPRYVHYYLLHLYKDGYTKGLQHATTGIRNLDFSSYLEAKIPERQMPEQQKIAAILWKLQRAIATQDHLIAVTRDLKQSAMRHLFTHGLRGEPLKDTTIGLMPESWSPRTVLELCRIQSGGTPRKSNAEYWKGDIPWVSGKDLKTVLLNDAIDHVSAEGVTAGSRLVPAGSVLLLVRGMGLAKDLPVAVITRPMAFNQDLKALVPRGEYSGEFLRSAIYVGKERLLERIVASAHGTMTLNLDDVETFALACPSDPDEANDIATALAAIDRKLAHHQKKRAALHDLFQTTLHQLMTAQIRVADLDIDTSGVTTHHYKE